MGKINIKGKYNDIIVFADNLDNTTKEQIENLANQEFTTGSKIRIMPDCHAGAGCVIGTTMQIKDKIVPNLVGVDIGCGMLTVKLGNINLDLKALDKYITNNIPCGMKGYDTPQIMKVNIKDLRCYAKLTNKEYHYTTMGTLGGGNHFIEVDIDKDNNKYLIIHSGSRNLGLQVANYYQEKAYEYNLNKELSKTFDINDIIREYKEQNREKEIQTKINEISNFRANIKIDKDLCYLEGDLFLDYIHDMDIAQKFAEENRLAMATKIVGSLDLNINDLSYFQTIHNYINMHDMILRKGAISAYKDELVLIPINMRDGCILARGKSCEEYNYSAPHGAGRILSRSEAQKQVNLNDFKETMKGIYSTSINQKTVDESPFAYKPIEAILENISDTVEIIDIIKPIYNFKCSI